MLEFSLGLITGLLISIINIVLFYHFKIPIQRNIEQLRNAPILQNGPNKAMIVGLSHEESAYMESLPADKQVEII